MSVRCRLKVLRSQQTSVIAKTCHLITPYLPPQLSLSCVAQSQLSQQNMTANIYDTEEFVYRMTRYTKMSQEKAITTYASNIGSEHVVGLAGNGAGDKMPLLIYEMHAWIVLMLGWVFLPFYARSGVFTMPEFLEKMVWFKSASKVYGPTINYTLNILRFPSFQSPLVLPDDLRNKFKHCYLSKNCEWH